MKKVTSSIVITSLIVSLEIYAFRWPLGAGTERITGADLELRKEKKQHGSKKQTKNSCSSVAILRILDLGVGI